MTGPAEPNEGDLLPLHRPASNPADAVDADDVWSGDELEQIYQRALDTIDTVEWELQQSEEANSEGVGTGVPETPTEHANATGDPAATASEPPSAAEAIAHAGQPSSSEEGLVGTTPKQIIEAVLFVGGMPLTAKKLASVLRGDFEAEHAAEIIDGLNLQYLRENRPYEIRLAEGGYRLQLRPDFERVRNKVYGFGPKEVKLSQDALEVLSLVAYRQPIGAEEIEALGKQGANPILRQLLRRELIAVERDKDQPKAIRYRTTPRFLSVFGLRDLDELPQADELNFK